MQKIRFDDFVRLNRGFDLPDSQIVGGDYPVVASTDIKAYHNQYKIEPPVVVTGRSGSLGKVQYIDQKCWPLNTSLYSKDFRGNHPKYVYYYLQMMHLEQYNAGAGVPTLNQNHLHNLKILIHSVEEQQKIASILSAYDSQIENNQKRIKLLEQMAENLYKEWFVRFRFPSYKTAEFEGGVPRGWNVNVIGNLFETSSGGTPSRKEPQYFENGNIGWVKTGELLDSFIIDTEEKITGDAVRNSAAKIIPIGSLLCSMYAGVGKLGITTTPLTCSQATCVFNPKAGVSNKYLFYYLKLNKKYLENISFGAAQQNISQEIIKKIKMIVPPNKLIQSFDEIIEPLWKDILLIMQQNRKLSTQRDLLLPRLMSGKLSI